MKKLLRHVAPVIAALVLGPAASSAAFGDQYVYCDDGLRRLSFYGEGEEHVSWGKKLEIDGALLWGGGCSYSKATDIPLEAINDWSIDVSGKNVRIFHGIGNVCSAGQFLLYNQLSKIVLVVHPDFTTEQFQCE